MDAINRLLARQVDDGKTPSVQYCHFSGKDILHRFAYGMADVKSGTPAHGDSIYRYYSITKTFTAVAVLQLVQKGLLELDRPAQQYLPNFPYGNEATVRHLLTHTAGIPNPLPLHWMHAAETHQTFDQDIFFKTIFEKNPRLKSRPGEKFAYSNLGFVLLGQIIGQVSGRSYQEYVRENIISRLGIPLADLDFATHDTTRQVKGYHRRMSFSNVILGLLLDKKRLMGPPEGPWNTFADAYVNGSAYGGLIGTAPALVHYAQALLAPQSPLLSDGSRKQMFEENKTSNGKPTGMCLGWYTGHLKGKRYVTHAGGGGGFYIEVRVYPDLDRGSVIVFNRTGFTDERFLDKVDSRQLTVDRAVR
ncbi:MAG: beta-lactamase family protein [Saprospiraceae bacterium]|nr:beta-lactamase family protein [Saprospiraceae bacterium]